MPRKARSHDMLSMTPWPLRLHAWRHRPRTQHGAAQINVDETRELGEIAALGAVAGQDVGAGDIGPDVDAAQQPARPLAPRLRPPRRARHRPARRMGATAARLNLAHHRRRAPPSARSSPPRSRLRARRPAPPRDRCRCWRRSPPRVCRPGACSCALAKAALIKAWPSSWMRRRWSAPRKLSA